MTKGSIVRNLIIFAFPLLLGNLFQQLYNMVDTWVIGQTGESGAYAAVGSVGPIINILIGFFSGLASGAGVVISQYFGAKDYKKVSSSAHTAMALTLVLGVAFTVIGVAFTPLILKLMLHSEGNTGEVYPFAKEYLTIYFSGLLGLMIYNMGAGILRAVGDSQKPFYFLLVSAVTNTVLDLLFVFKFGMGVRGVALATVIAQFLSAVCTVITLIKSTTCVRIRLKALRIDRDDLGKIVKIGFPAAIQMALTAFSNVFVQSYISNVSSANTTAALGGWTTYSKIDQFIFLPIQSIALAVTTFVGQNLGVGDVKRAKAGTRVAWIMASVCTVVLMIPVMIFASSVSAVFNSDPGIVECSALLLHRITPFYLLCCVNQVFSASLRGSGNSRAPMIIMLCSFVGFRQLYLFVMSTYISNDLLPIALSYPAGWLACALTTVIYYKRCNFARSRLTK